MKWYELFSLVCSKVDRKTFRFSLRPFKQLYPDFNLCTTVKTNSYDTMFLSQYGKEISRSFLEPIRACKSSDEKVFAKFKSTRPCDNDVQEFSAWSRVIYHCKDVYFQLGVQGKTHVDLLNKMSIFWALFKKLRIDVVTDVQLDATGVGIL